MRQDFNDWKAERGQFRRGLDKERSKYASKFSLRKSYNEIRQQMVNL